LSHAEVVRDPLKGTNRKIEDPAQKKEAQKALDARAPIKTLNQIVYQCRT
jgi:hypothetical protein